MQKLFSKLVLGCSVVSSLCAYASPRDAAAVLNRCGAPFKGDETIYENTLSGGRRVLSYQRGILTFNRVANDGWTFAFGEHDGAQKLSPEQMQPFLPCLKDALADASSSKPLPVLNSGDRMASALQDPVVKLAGVGFFVLFGGVCGFGWLTRRFRGVDSMVAE